MARITVEDCLQKIDTRFQLIHMAAKRVRQLRKGEEPLVDCKNKDVVVSLREIAAGKVFPVKDEDSGLLVEGLQEPALEALPGVESVELPDQEPAKGEVTSEDD
ncbi:MAG: DNA-directed RNA polymerase subunit omega [Desulfatiglans sp.]|nr:DNA-directed RNA polymerase subunit omega [Thermodesulfobacteriota bacterium]MEE4353727.1 DNA-directed RNA polymerase subunit omega [Desulfatiglans sp.]